MNIKNEKRKLLVSLLNSAKISRVLSGNFSYRTHEGIVYNDTLFTQYAGIPYSKDMSFLALQITVEVKLTVVSEILSGLKKYFHDDRLVLKAIEEKILQIEYIKSSLPFELEKAGYQLWATEAEKIKQQVDALEEKLYGKSSVQNKQEIEMCYAYIYKKYETKKHLLSQKQQQGFCAYIEQIEQAIEPEKTYKFKKILKESLSFHFFREYWHTQIPKDVYLKVFRLVLDISGMQDYEILIWNNGNISLTRENLLIPESSSYNFLPLERVLRIITHEIMVHGITWKNQKRFFGRITGAKYLLKEEWLASYMEARLLWENAKTINLKPMATARIFAGEILSGDEFWNFIEIYRVLTGQKTSSVKKTFLRNKSCQSKLLPGTYRKDLSYLRGLKILRQHALMRDITNEKNMLALFSGKISFEDCLSYGEKLVSHERFVRPVNISDYLIFHLSKNKKYTSLKEYLENKYPDMYTIFREYESLSAVKQKKLSELLDILSPYCHG